LLDVLDVKGAIVTLDAMGCQRTIATKILEKGADYLVTLKANQGKKHSAVQKLCAATCFSQSPTHQPVHDECDDGHGRLVRRRVFVCSGAVALEPLRDWPGLKSVLAVETIRGVNGCGKTEAEIRYFLSSSAEQPEVLANAIRRHWQIENSLHWVLDVAFNEDRRRIRDRNAVQNFSLLRKIAINLVRRHQTSKASLKGRWKMAAWDNHYMEQVLTSIFHA
jgi:predicted transposase YbfD/YdcC